MIITFADALGGNNACFPGMPAPDGFADPVVKAGGPGTNNFKVFVLGTGPDRRNFSAVFGTKFDTRKIDFQVDFSIYSGLTVDEEGKVYVVSGGTPANVGTNPSPTLGEILAFPDDTPFDRKADYIDLRGEVVPNPGVTNQNEGNGISDRFDHIFWQAPIDPVSSSPAGIAGLSHGFLLYVNRNRNITGRSIDLLPNGDTQAINSTAGPIFFDDFDPSHQVAGGDDQNYPYRGDDSDGFSKASDPPIAGLENGGFELNFGANISGTCTSPWNSFFVNSNGNVTFGSGDTSASPTIASFLTGAPRIAAAWAKLDTESREDGFINTFPVQAMGFANINNFVVRWIDVPETGQEACVLPGAHSPGDGHLPTAEQASSNTFSAYMYDDGTGVDENATQTLNAANPIGNNAVPFDLLEGPTDLRFSKVVSGMIGSPPRPDGSGYVRLHYGRMDLIGTSSSADLVGYSLGKAGESTQAVHEGRSRESALRQADRGREPGGGVRILQHGQEQRREHESRLRFAVRGRESADHDAEWIQVSGDAGADGRELRQQGCVHVPEVRVFTTVLALLFSLTCWRCSGALQGAD